VHHDARGFVLVDGGAVGTDHGSIICTGHWRALWLSYALAVKIRRHNRR
jgi:hypothetical protein